MIRLWLTSILLFMLTISSAFAAELAIRLEVSTSPIKKGTVPVFTVTVRNISKNSVKILDVVKRPDFKDAYARLSVTRSGKRANVPVMISDPGPIGATDWLTLEPGQTLKFEHNGSPLRLEELNLGSYEASLQLIYKIESTPIRSNIVRFNVAP